ncbi:hypothetical protein D3C72_2159180 [compost metagenome]
MTSDGVDGFLQVGRGDAEILARRGGERGLKPIGEGVVNLRAEPRRAAFDLAVQGGQDGPWMCCH